MSNVKGNTHRPGPFKQTNKQHKHGKHRSKGSITGSNKGKVSVKSVSKKNKRNLNKIERRNRGIQIRQMKRDEVLSKKRSLGCHSTAPFLVCVLPLNKQLDPNTILSFVTKCDENALVCQTPTGCTHIRAPCLKQRFTFVTPKLDNNFEILDTLKVCDTVMFFVSAAAGFDFSGDIIDDWGQSILLSAFSQGLPTPLVVVTELDCVPFKKRNDQKQNIQKLVSKWMPNEKIMMLSNEIDGLNVLRRISNQKHKPVTNRDRRSHLYGEDYEYIVDESGITGTLKIMGYLRGAALSVNDLAHLPGLGDFQMSQIEYQEFAHGECAKILKECDPRKQESLESENMVDVMDADQTWPTIEELKIAENERKNKKAKKVPKGWSDYQAAWIPEDDAESLSSIEDIDSQYVDAISEENSDIEEFDNVTESDIPIKDQTYDEELDLYIEKEELEKIKAAHSDMAFPDEMDTPQNIPARIRFQKYRGLESFRTSPWDVNEDLPSDYARIFQFQNFDHTKKRIVSSQKYKDGISPGLYITVHIKNVSNFLWSTFKGTKAPLILIGLLPHEHKMSVLNVVLKRTSNCDVPIQSKERLIFQCGYRRFIVNPIFSQHTNGKKHKYERYFHSNSTTVATFYAPIQFPPSPVLCFKEMNEKLVLIAHGSLLSCNPSRLIVKRIVLSGHPYKINKRHAVIRFMFFNKEDIIYFKPIKLRTKYGRIGHIKEALGTRGHMKCLFDGQLKSMDTVVLYLYKRKFPKWTYEECIVKSDKSLNMEI